MTTTQTLISMCLAVAAVAVTAISGCGSGDATAEAPPTKKQFILKAEEICRNAEREQLLKGTKYLRNHPGAEEENAVVPAALPPIEKELDRLGSLGAPSGDEAEVAAFLSALKVGVEQARIDPGSAVTVKGNPFNKPDQLARKYGLEICANNP